MRRNGIGLAAAVLLLGWALGAPAQDRRPAFKVPEGVKVVRDLEYVPGGHARQKLDLYLPEKKSDQPLPVIVWVHGGGWQGGSKVNPPGLWLVKKGYALASVNYRLSQHAKFPAQIEDCKAAVGWLHANAKKYNLDPQHVGAWGASAGGHLVALLGTTGNGKNLGPKGAGARYPSRVQAVVDLFGPTDLLALAGKRGGAESPISKLLGGPVKDHEEEAKQANPITYVGKDTAPFLILHGDKDTLVPLRQSELLADALKKAGVEVRLITLKGAGHGGPAFGQPEQRRAVEEFFDKHLKGGAKK